MNDNMIDIYRILFKPKEHYVTIRNDKDYPTKVLVEEC